MSLLKFKLECMFYSGYSSLNAKRKAKEKTNPLYKAVDDLRRRTGFVK